MTLKRRFPRPPVKDLHTFEDIMLILAGHYLVKARLLGMSEEDIFADLSIEISNFDLDIVTDVAISMLIPTRTEKLN